MDSGVVRVRDVTNVTFVTLVLARRFSIASRHDRAGVGRFVLGRAGRVIRSRRLPRSSKRGLVSESALEKLRDRYLRLFEGEYETGIRPDEVNWMPGRDPEDRTRQLCNAWKSDNMVVAAQVLSESTGSSCGAARRLPRCSHPSGQRALEAPGHEGDRLPPGLLVCRLSRSRRDGHVLDLPPRDAGRRRSSRVRRAAPTRGRSRRHPVRSSTPRRTGSREPAQPHPPTTSPRRCPLSSSPVAARFTTA